MLHNISKQIKTYIKCQNLEYPKIITFHVLVHGFTLTILIHILVLPDHNYIALATWGLKVIFF